MKQPTNSLTINHYLLTPYIFTPQYLQRVASSLIISAQCGHFWVTPFATTDGSRKIAITRSGTIAHKINHSSGLRPFGWAKMAPTIPTTTIKM